MAFETKCPQVHQQAGLSASRHSSLIAYSQQYLRSISSQQPAISYIEEADGRAASVPAREPPNVTSGASQPYSSRRLPMSAP
mgnify:CR=1 FL=1